MLFLSTFINLHLHCGGIFGPMTINTTYLHTCLENFAFYSMPVCVMYIHSTYVTQPNIFYDSCLVFIFMSDWVTKCMHACMQAYIHTYIHTYMHTYIHTYIHTCIHTYIHTYIHAYIHTYIHIYIHTYIGYSMVSESCISEFIPRGLCPRGIIVSLYPEGFALGI